MQLDSASWISMHSDKQQRALLIVLAHPDDEFAVLPWVEAATGVGRPLHLVWLTDGGWGGQSVQVREDETKKVLGRIGVQAQSLHFLGAKIGITDGSLHLHVEQASEQLLHLVRAFECDEIMAPAWEGGHQDHDAAHLVACAVAAKLDVPAWEFSLYHGHGVPPPFFKVLKLIPAPGRSSEPIGTQWRQRLRYVVSCLAYRSQWKSFVGLLPFYALRLSRTNAFQRRRILPELTGAKPHTGYLLYERRTALSWEEFAAATARLRNLTTAP